MNNIEIIAQVIVLIAYLICGVVFLQKKQYKILIFVSIFNLLMLIQYYLRFFVQVNYIKLEWKNLWIIYHKFQYLNIEKLKI